MQPKNKSERLKAFVNFLLLLMLSIGIIITTVFFSIEVPIKQANDLRSQIHRVEKERVIAAGFLTSMSEIVGMLDTINTMKAPELLDLKIKEKIETIQVMADADTVYDQRLYQNVVKNMYDLWKTKKQLRELTSNENQVKELQAANAALQDKLDKRTDDYNTLQRQFSQPNPR